MSLRIKNLLSGLVALVACTTTHAGLLSSEERSVVPLPDVAPATLTFRAVDSDNVPYPDSTLTKQLGERVREATGVLPRQQVQSDGSTWKFGVRATYSESNRDLVIFYDAHEITTNGVVLGQTIAISIHVDQTTEGDHRVVRLLFPPQAISTVKKLVLFRVPLLKVEEVVADYSRVAAALGRAQLVIPTVIRGEMDAKYRPDAVLANFDRLVGRDRSSTGGRAHGNESD